MDFNNNFRFIKSRAHSNITDAKIRTTINIDLDKKIHLTGPFDENYYPDDMAWDRLRDLTGKDIIPLNPHHQKATRITFNGIKIQPHYKGFRRWTVDYYVQYPDEEFGSGWNLSTLEMDSNILVRQKTETIAAWFDRVADYIESIIQ